MDALLRRLAGDPANGIERVITAQELTGWRAFPGAAFVVALKPGYQYGSRVKGPLVQPRSRGGMHGYPPDNPQMKASFFVMGPDIRRGESLGEIDMRDVAPTLAHLLGLTLATAEGNILRVTK